MRPSAPAAVNRPLQGDGEPRASAWVAACCTPERVAGSVGEGRRRGAREPFPWIGAVLALVLALGTSGMAVPHLQAQDNRSAGPLLLELPVSTRGMALGGGVHAGARDSDAVFALPGLLNNPTGMVGAFQAWGRGGSLAQLSAGTDWWSGGVALGVRSLHYGTMEGTFAGLPRDEGDLRGRGRPHGAAELQVTGGYGRVIRGFRMGATASLVQLQVGGQRDFTGALGVGVARSVRGVVLSAAAVNLGPELSQGGTSLDLARRFTLAASPSSSRPVGPLDLNATAYLSLLEDNALSGGAGVEVAWWPIQGRTLIARAGLRDVDGSSPARPFTLGGGFQGDRLGLDYAVVPFRSGVATHRIGLHFR